MVATQKKKFALVSIEAKDLPCYRNTETSAAGRRESIDVLCSLATGNNERFPLTESLYVCIMRDCDVTVYWQASRRLSR